MQNHNMTNWGAGIKDFNAVRMASLGGGGQPNQASSKGTGATSRGLPWTLTEQDNAATTARTSWRPQPAARPPQPHGTSGAPAKAQGGRDPPGAELEKQAAPAPHELRAPEPPKPPPVVMCTREVYCCTCIRLLQVNVAPGQRAVKISCPGCNSSFPLEHPLEYRPPDEDGDATLLPPLPNAVCAALYMTRIARNMPVDDLFELGQAKKKEAKKEEGVQGAGASGKKRKGRGVGKDEGEDKGKGAKSDEEEEASKEEGGKHKKLKKEGDGDEEIIDLDEERPLPAAVLDWEDESCDLDDETVGRILECWSFVVRASNLVELKPMSLRDFVLALMDQTSVEIGETPRLVDEVLIAMLKGACRDIYNPLKAVRALGALNIVTWPEAARGFLEWRARNLYSHYVGCPRGEDNEMIDYGREPDVAGTEEGTRVRERMDKALQEEGESLRRLAAKIEERGFDRLALKEKLDLLDALCSQINNTPELHEETDEIMAQHQQRVHNESRTVLWTLLGRELSCSDEAVEEGESTRKHVWEADDKTLGTILLRHRFVVRPASALRLESPAAEPIMIGSMHPLLRYPARPPPCMRVFALALPACCVCNASA